MDGIIMAKGSSGTAARGIAGQDRQTDTTRQGMAPEVELESLSRRKEGYVRARVACRSRRWPAKGMCSGWMVLVLVLPTACSQDESMEAESQFPEPKSAA